MGWLSSEAGRNTLGSSLVQTGSNAVTAAINYRFNKKLMEMQNDQQIKMWQMNNQYNDPSAQVQRLRDAGINPFTLENGSGASSVPAVTPNSANYTPFNMDTAGLDATLGMLTTNAENIEADTNKKRVEIEECKQSIDLIRKNAQLSEAQKEYIINQQHWNDILNTWQEMINEKSLAKLRSDIGFQNLTNSYYQLAYPVMLAGAKEDIAIKFAQEALLKVDAKVNEHQIKLMNAQIKKIYAEAKSTDLSNQIVSQTKKAQIRHINNMTDLSDFKKKHEQWYSDHMVFEEVAKPLLGTVLNFGANFLDDILPLPSKKFK